MKKITFTLLFCAAIVKVSFSQHFLDRYTQGITPMHKFFQQYTDSTIIVEYQVEGYTPKYRILTKTNDIVNSYYYEPLDTTWQKISSVEVKKNTPLILWHMISNKKVLFKDMPADINIFFNLAPMLPDTLKKIWKDILKLKPWNLEDEKIFGYGCKNVEDPVTSENRPDIIHLITKKEIKSLFFRSPSYFEKLCPGNKNRQAINSINEIFYKNFPKFKGVYY